MITEQEILNHFLKRQKMDDWLAAYLVLALTVPVHTIGSILSWIPNGIDDPRSIPYIFEPLQSLHSQYPSYWGFENGPTALFGNVVICIVFDSLTTGRRHSILLFLAPNEPHCLRFLTPCPFPTPLNPVPFTTLSELCHLLAPILHKMLEHINKLPEQVDEGPE